MEAGELLRKIINLPIISRSLAEEMLNGGFRSIFKGQGMEFDEARHYQAGDDIRSIDWNASARFGHPFVKMYREERELTILVLIDTSLSMHAEGVMRRSSEANGDSEVLSPYEQALICASLIAFSAENTDQQVGAFLFDKDIEKVFPPRKGRKHIMSLIMAALQYQNKQTLNAARADKTETQRGSNIAAALTGAQRMLKKRSLVVVISDFFSINWEQELGTLCRKHDCLALRICGLRDVPYSGLITLEDPETGVRMEAPAGLSSFKESWDTWHEQRTIHWESQCRKSGAAYLDLSVETDAPSALMKFFSSRTIGQFKNRKKI